MPADRQDHKLVAMGASYRYLSALMVCSQCHCRQPRDPCVSSRVTPKVARRAAWTGHDGLNTKIANAC